MNLLAGWLGWTLFLVIGVPAAVLTGLTFLLAAFEPNPLEINGEAYTQKMAPYVRAASAIPAGELVARVVLIGDAGDPAEENVDTLSELDAWTRAAPDRTVTLFLGDNVYSVGFEPEDLSRGGAILGAQLNAAHGPAYVIPGNHDWGHTDGMHLERILAQQAFVDAAPDATYLPRDGCPGPEVTALLPEADLPRPILMVAVGTTWLLEPMSRPDCARVHYEVMQALEDTLLNTGDAWVIVAGHHPIVTAGPHGGFERGVIRPAFQALYGAQGTLGKPVYELVMEDLGRALAANRPLVYAAGHEHSLQLYRDGARAEYLIVSGAGAAGHVNTVTTLPNTLFAHAHPGFVSLDFERMPSGTVSVIARVIESGLGEVYATRLAGEEGNSSATAAPGR